VTIDQRVCPLDWTIIASGFVGAAAPEIVRLYRLRDQLPKVHIGYFLISVAFFLLGAFAAWIFQSASPYAAFYVGACTDTLVSSIAGKAPTVTPPTPPPVTGPPPVPGEKKLTLEEKMGIQPTLVQPRHLTVREYLGALTGSARTE
jgi:hypothetical protein